MIVRAEMLYYSSPICCSIVEIDGMLMVSTNEHTFRTFKIFPKTQEPNFLKRP